MDGNNRVGITEVNSSRCKRIRSSAIESIPDELLFEILINLPAEAIYHAARLVCSTWYHMIRSPDFIDTHFQRASYGLVCRDIHGSILFVSEKEGNIETYKLNCYKFKMTIWGYPIWTSCNGLVLEKKEKDSVSSNIVNLSTSEAFRLPTCTPNNHLPYVKGIGYDVASMTYKVFATSRIYAKTQCSILSVGVDKSWRFISTHHLSPAAVDTLATSLPLINEGFMHWKINGLQIITLNVETEIITEITLPIPRPLLKKTRSIYHFCTGRHLSVLEMIGELEWKVWEMKPETGEWRELPNICIEGEKDRMEGLGKKEDGGISPCGWVKYRELLAFEIVNSFASFRFLCFYNLIKREICYKNVITDLFSELVLHKNSLVSPVGLGGGC